MSLLSKIINHEKFVDRDSEYIRWYPKSLTLPDFKNLFLDSLHPEGMYIHIPFCDKICSFCPYNKRLTDNKLIDSYVKALINEIIIYGKIVTSSNIKFIYFGGGTPSTLNSLHLGKVLDCIRLNFNVHENVEITLEGHPSHLNINYLNQIKDVGITRISTGVQSFDDKLLKEMGSQHTAKQAFTAINNVSEVFGEVAIDLLFNCPTQSLSNWEKQLKIATELPGVTHISCYSLILPNNENQPSKVEEVRMTEWMDNYLRQKGYIHYASCASGGFDYSKEGHHCVYEKSHWGSPQTEFLGLGAGAMGFVGDTATVNGLNIKNYMSKLNNNNLPLVSTTFTDKEEKLRRHFVLGVKTLQVNFDDINIPNYQIIEFFKNEFSILKDWGFAEITDKHLRLTDIGRMYIDSVSTLFFSEDEKTIAHPEEPEIKIIEKQVSSMYDFVS